MKSTLKGLLANALVAVSFGVLSLTSAQAALWSGTWDPRYGQPFDANFDSDVLGWRGNALFEIPDACVIIGTVNSSSCAGMQLVSAQVDFYDFATDVTFETFNYASTDLSGFSATFDAGATVTSLTSDFFAPRSPVSSFSIIDLYTFNLQFIDDGVRMYHSKDYELFGLPVGPYSPAECEAKWLLKVTQPWVCGYSGQYSDGTSAPAVLVGFTRVVPVPEPGSLALLLAAAAAGLAARATRKRRIAS